MTGQRLFLDEGEVVYCSCDQPIPGAYSEGQKAFRCKECDCWIDARIKAALKRREESSHV